MYSRYGYGVHAKFGFIFRFGSGTGRCYEIRSRHAYGARAVMPQDKQK